MRTTLTLADDVVAQVDKVRRQRRARFKDVVNEALRVGLRELGTSTRKGTAFHTTAVDLGPCLVGSVDDISEALSIAEGDTYT